MHSHSDRKIKTCPTCQKALQDIAESAKELDRTGVWNIPKTMKKGVDYTVWERK